MQVEVGVGVRLRLGLGSMLNNLEFVKEEVNTGAGLGWGQIKVGVGNSFLIPD